MRVTGTQAPRYRDSQSDNRDEMATKWLTGGILWTKGLLTSQAAQSRMAREFIMLFRTVYNLKVIISGIFHLIFSDYSWPQVTESVKIETKDKGGLFMGLPRWLSGKESTCRCRRHRFNPWVRKISWRRKWQPTPVFLPGKSQGQRSLADYSS